MGKRNRRAARMAMPCAAALDALPPLFLGPVQLYLAGDPILPFDYGLAFNHQVPASVVGGVNLAILNAQVRAP